MRIVVRRKGQEAESGCRVSEVRARLEKGRCLDFNFDEAHRRQEGGEGRRKGGQGREIGLFILLRAKTEAKTAKLQESATTSREEGTRSKCRTAVVVQSI